MKERLYNPDTNTIRVSSDPKGFLKRVDKERQAPNLYTQKTGILGENLFLYQKEIKKTKKILKIPEVKKVDRKIKKRILIEIQNTLASYSDRKPEELQKWLETCLLEIPNFQQIVAENDYVDYSHEEDQEYIDLEWEKDHDTPLIEALEKERSDFIRRIIAHEVSEMFLEAYESKEKETYISEKTLKKILEVHITLLREKKEKMEKEIKEEFTIQFKKTWKSFSKKFGIELSLEAIDSLIAEVAYSIVDQFTTNLEEKWGDYSANKHQMRLSTEIPDKETRYKVFVHETLHAISGKTEIVILPDDPDVRKYEELYITEIKRIGLDMRKNQKEKQQDNFRWFNESVTEEITIRMTNSEDSWAYISERKILELLITWGVPQRLIYQAYFENRMIKKGTSDTHSTPFLQKLFQFTNKKFGVTFLIQLDRFITKYGAKIAYTILQNHTVETVYDAIHKDLLQEPYPPQQS